MSKWINVNDRLPKMNEEHLASIDLDDGYNTLVCFAVEFRVNTKTWVWSNTEEIVSGVVMFWQEKPKAHPYKKPKQAIDQSPVTLDEFERTTYGQCTHGENL